MQSEELIPNRSWKKLKDTDLSLSLMIEKKEQEAITHVSLSLSPQPSLHCLSPPSLRIIWLRSDDVEAADAEDAGDDGPDAGDDGADAGAEG